MNRLEWIQNFEAEHLFLVQLSAGLAAMAIVFITLVFVKRFRKIWMDQEKEWFLRSVVPQLGSLVVVERTRLQWRKEIKQLVALIGNSPFKRQVLIDHLRYLKNDLTGDSANVIMKLYHDLNLVEHSQQKLANRNWKKQVEGVRELAAMNHYSENILNVFKYLLLRTKNKTLRNELVTAIVLLDKQEPFKGLELIDFELTGWMQLMIHHHLAKYNPAELPHFAKWFHHHREEVVLFFIALTREFRQTSSVPALADLLQGRKSEAVEALKTLTYLKEYHYINEVAGMINTYWGCAETSMLILHYLQQANDFNRVSAFVDRYRFHPEFSIQRKANLILATTGADEPGPTFLSTLQMF